MKVIFLDVDGVLNNKSSLMRREFLSAELIDRLVSIQRRSGAVIVLTSTWRLGLNDDLSVKKNIIGADIEQLLSIFASLSLPLYDKTGRDKDANRGKEILEWLSNHEVEQYVIIDDDSFDIACYDSLKPHLVKTDTFEGITDDDVIKAIKILRGVL